MRGKKRKSLIYKLVISESKLIFRLIIVYKEKIAIAAVIVKKTEQKFLFRNVFSIFIFKQKYSRK